MDTFTLLIIFGPLIGYSIAVAFCFAIYSYLVYKGRI